MDILVVERYKLFQDVYEACPGKRGLYTNIKLNCPSLNQFYSRCKHSVTWMNVTGHKTFAFAMKFL